MFIICSFFGKFGKQASADIISIRRHLLRHLTKRFLAA